MATTIESSIVYSPVTPRFRKAATDALREELFTQFSAQVVGDREYTLVYHDYEPHRGHMHGALIYADVAGRDDVTFSRRREQAGEEVETALRAWFNRVYSKKDFPPEPVAAGADEDDDLPF